MRRIGIIERLLGWRSAIVAVALSVGGLGLLPTGSWAQTGGVAWSVTMPEVVPDDGRFEIVFEATISPGWYIYAMDSPAGRPLQIVADGLPSGFSAGEPTQSGPVEGYDPNFDATVRKFEDYAEFRQPIIVDQTASAGIHTIAGSIEYMYCSDRVCIPANEPFLSDVELLPTTEAGLPTEPEEVKPEIVEPVQPDKADVTEADPTVPPGPTTMRQAPNDLEDARSGGLLGFLLVAIGAGIAALLTPCVFPMIPLTISFFSRQSENRSQAVRMAIVYGLSIVLIFTGLGVLMALLLGAAGAQIIATNPWINLAIGAVFVVFALSLLGLFELRLPHRFVNYVNRQGDTKGGIIGVLFMGLTLTLVSFSCTAPFVGGLLAATATSNEWSWPVLGMLVFSATFALPFVLFALFPKWLSSLPKSGAWMNSVKITLGFVELAAAFKFLSNADLVWGWGLLSRTLVISVWIVIFALAGFYLLGMLRLINDERVEAVGTIRVLFAIGFLGFSLYLFPGLLGAPLNNVDAYLPPRLATDVSLTATLGGRSGESHDGLDWLGNDSQPFDAVMDNAFEASRIERKPVLIDFTGYTCTNCRQMEANVFPSPAIAERLKSRFILLRLFTDDVAEGPELQRYQLRLTGTVALPTYAVVDSDGQLLSRWMGMASVEEFTEFLDHSVAEFAMVDYSE